jgi:hypothetical protein
VSRDHLTSMNPASTVDYFSTCFHRVPLVFLPLDYPHRGIGRRTERVLQYMGSVFLSAPTSCRRNAIVPFVYMGTIRGEVRDECHTPRRRGPAVLPPCAQGRRSHGGAVVQGRSRCGRGEEVAAWARRCVPPPWLRPRRGRAGAMGEGSLFAHADGKQGAARGWPRGSEE